MSLAVSPFHVFRSCRVSLASRNLSRSAFTGSPTLSRIRTRHYTSDGQSSTETTQPQTEVDKNSDRTERASDVDPCADVKNSLKAKEAEVVDLTVCVTNFFFFSISGLPLRVFRADCDIYRRTFLTFSVTRQERRNKQKTTQSPDSPETFSKQSTSSP